MKTHINFPAIFSLTYRGISYAKKSSSLAMEPTQIQVQYRRQTYFLPRPAELPSVSQHKLIYRGIHYCHRQNTPINVDDSVIPCQV